MQLDMQLFGNLQPQPSSQSHQQDENEDQISHRPPAGILDILQYDPTAALLPIQEEVVSLDALTYPQHVDELPGAHEPTTPQGVSPQHIPMGQQPITTSSQSLPPQPRQGEHLASAQHPASQQSMLATGSIPVQPPYMPCSIWGWGDKHILIRYVKK